jgi:hypothetical protein
LNVEEAGEFFHAAHESLIAMMEQLQKQHTTVCQALNIYLQVQQAGSSVCVDFVCVLSEAEISFMVVFRDEVTSERTTEMLSREAGPIP